MGRAEELVQKLLAKARHARFQVVKKSAWIFFVHDYRTLAKNAIVRWRAVFLQ
jgi:hypothetical protein